MILYIIIVIIVILIVYFLCESEKSYPTLYARCKEGSTCGGDLVCDLTCHRCKKSKGGACAVHNDCEIGLICSDWICIDPPSTPIQEKEIPINPTGRKIRFVDSE